MNAYLVTRLIPTLIAVLGAAFSARADRTNEVKPNVAGNNLFALDLYERLKTEEGNLIFSPYSISSCMGMAYAGARGNTAKEISLAMRFSSNQRELPSLFRQIQEQWGLAGQEQVIELKEANALWAQKEYPFLPDFVETMTRDYQANVNQADFVHDAESARKEINEWVAAQTNGKIGEILPIGSLNKAQILVLVDAMYFRAAWLSRFDRKRTKNAPFWVAPERKVEVPTMFSDGTFRFAQMERLKLLELPYAGNGLSMILLLPLQQDGLAELDNLLKGVDSLAELESSLTESNLAAWLSNARRTNIVVSLPRFTIAQRFVLKETFAGMGVKDAFGDKADFSGMDGTRKLYLSDIFHAAFVEVNEEGTVAAASTGLSARYAGPPRPPPQFTADHPFIFLIRDNRSGSILFMGRMVDPTK
jgi:serine protease inhibitor